MVCEYLKSIIHAGWCSPLEGTFNFNVDGTARGKADPIGIGRVFRNFKGEVLTCFFMPIGIKDSNEE